MNENKKNETIGRAIVTLSWWIFAVKFIIIVSIITAVILYFINKPLWIAPVVDIGVFIIYRLIWRLIWVFIGWAGRQ